MVNKERFSLGLVLFTEVIGFTLILPFLPYYAEELGANPLIIGLIFASFSICQFFSAPVIGKLSDKYGRKPLLIISQLSTLAGFLILGLANTIFLIFLSRIIDGLLGSNMTLTKTYISDLSKSKERAKVYSKFGAVEGLGYFVGPAMGGLLASINYALPSFIAAGITLVSIALTVKFLPETVDPSAKKEVVIKPSDFFPAKQFISGLRVKNWRRIFIQYFSFFLGFSIIPSSLAIFVKHQLTMSTAEVGLLLMLIGSLRIIYQAKSLPRLIDKFEEYKLKIWGFVITVISLILFYFIFNRLTFYIIMGLFGIGVGLTQPMIISEASRVASKRERGKLMGVLDAFYSISQIIAPVIGGYMLTFFNPGSLGPISAIIVFVGFVTAVSDFGIKKIFKKG